MTCSLQSLSSCGSNSIDFVFEVIFPDRGILLREDSYISFVL